MQSMLLPVDLCREIEFAYSFYANEPQMCLISAAVDCMMIDEAKTNKRKDFLFFSKTP